MPKANIPTVIPTHDDWVRLAAYIDGEGYIGIISTKGTRMKSVRYLLKVEVANTDIRLVLWCKERFGGSVSRQMPRKARPNEKICFHWVIGARVAGSILVRCLPYFILKRQEAEIAIAFQGTMKRAGGGSLITPHVVLQRETLRNNMLQLGTHGRETFKRSTIPIEVQN